MLIAGAVAVSFIAAGTADAATGPAPAAQSHGSPQWGGQSGHYDYYLALGDSLAYGVQVTAQGVEYGSGKGYTADLAAYLKQDQGDRGLKYVNLSCPGETTGTMLDGGCPWLSELGDPYTTQIAAATSFLRQHRHARILVTLDIGANNVDGCLSGGSIDASCVAGGIADAAADLPQLLAKLKAAAGPRVSFVGMNYYDPFLAEWLTGSTGQTLAEESVALSATFNGVLDAAYAAYGVPVADVSGAFKTADFTDTASLDGLTVPVNVANICDWTYMCAPAPVGPNIHANTTGYEVMARSFESVLPSRHWQW
jgi:lysophospholipase L1-like esterase